MKLSKFSGINNVLDARGLSASELSAASNIDLDLEGKPSRRAGFASSSVLVHKNLWESAAYTLCTRGASGDLYNLDAATVLHAGLGHTPRVWFCNLPDGRTLYSNGVTQGIVSASGLTVSSWGVPIPVSVGAAANAVGGLHPGDYQWSLTHRRTADGVESGPAYSGAVVAVTTGGVSLSSLPVLAGHTTNIYLTSHFGGERYLAGSTSGATFSFIGENKDLVLPCKTEFLRPAPAGKLVAFWRGRALVAVGNALFASKMHSWELFDLRRDFKQFSGTITLVNPVDGGIWVGTTKELVFLAGEKWDTLVRIVKVTGAVVLGSGCPVPGEQIAVGKGRGAGDSMVCIADGWLMAGMADGSLVPLTLDRYRTEVSEVSASFRVVGSIPQYIALTQ